MAHINRLKWLVGMAEKLHFVQVQIVTRFYDNRTIFIWNIPSYSLLIVYYVCKSAMFAFWELRQKPAPFFSVVIKFEHMFTMHIMYVLSLTYKNHLCA